MPIRSRRAGKSWAETILHIIILHRQFWNDLLFLSLGQFSIPEKTIVYFDEWDFNDAAERD